MKTWRLFLLVILINSTSLALADTLSIKVREVKLKAAPNFWSAAVAGLKYGDSVTELGEESGWYKVKSGGGKTGYLHPSSVTDHRIVLTAAKSGSSTVDRSEVVMAGKGFNREVERKYAASGGTLAYNEVDAMERIKVSDAEMMSFIKAGKLEQGGLQ